MTMTSRSTLRVRVALAAALSVWLAGSRVPAAPAHTTILWDTYGVPHIMASSPPALFHAFGWAQMESHGNLLLTLYGQARGRAAEYWGEKYLASDRWVLTNDIPERAQRWYDAQSPAFRTDLAEFADGINQYARERADRLSPEARRVLPVSPIDVLAHVQRVVHFGFVVSPQKMAAMMVDRRRPTTAGDDNGSPEGSNAWVIAPRHTAAGHALLVANPHLPWTDQYTFYEAQLSAPGVDAYGAALVGFPVLGIAFNDFVGWSHTVNTNDSADLYELTPADGGYVWDDQVKPFETTTHVIAVRQPNGDLRRDELVVRRSIHGPVFDTPDGRLVALRVAGLDQPGLCEEWWDMGRARSLVEFEGALRRLQIPMFTVMYADRAGHILHVFNARVPLRPAGPYTWATVVPGSGSKTLWTATHPYDDLPRLLDPGSGWMQNSNDPPWTTTFPATLDANRFPSYMAPRTMGFRAQRAASLLEADPRITFEKVIAYKHSTHMELADRILDDLIAAARRRGGDRLSRAADVLTAWDRAADSDSRGAVLFAEFVRRWWPSPAKFEIGWSERAPRETPNHLARPDEAVALLDAASEEVERRYGALDVPWGRVYRLRRGDVNLPSNGAAGDPLGIVRAIGYAPSADGVQQAVDGDSYIAVVEFGDRARAMALIGYGNASQPGSPHATDQLSFLAEKRLRPVWRTTAEIKAHLADTNTFQ